MVLFFSFDDCAQTGVICVGPVAYDGNARSRAFCSILLDITIGELRLTSLPRFRTGCDPGVIFSIRTAYNTTLSR